MFFLAHLPLAFEFTGLSLEKQKMGASFSVLEKWSNYIFNPRYKTTKRKALRNAELVFIEFIITAASNSNFRQDLYWQIQNFKNKSEKDKVKFFPGFYLFVERYIFNSVETSQQTFREAIYNQFALAIDQSPALKVIFLPGEKQVIAIYRRFLLSALKASPSLVRSFTNAAFELYQFLKGKSNMVTFSDLRKLDQKQQLIQLAHDFFNELCEHSSERIALKIFNEAYDRQALRYQNLNSFSEILKLFPPRALDEAKYNLLSYQQIKSLLTQKVNELEFLSEELQEKNKQLENQFDELSAQSEQLNLQNQQLSEAQELIEMMNGELQSYSKHLTEKVNERTRELAHSNKLLIHHNENLEQYTFTISHQLKAPIVRLIGLTNLLKLVPPAEAPVIAESVHKSAKELDGIFKDLVHSLNLKKDAGEAKKEKVKLQDLVNEVWTGQKGKPNFSSAIFTYNLNENETITTDPKHLIEAFTYLLDNALKFSQTDVATNVSIDIQQKNDKIEIAVKDSGIGFNVSEVESKLFTPFQRFNQTHNGRGMGLYLTKQHISILGGEINIHSSQGLGTEVRIQLPLEA
jgi:signal transduction histidine kinase